MVERLARTLPERLQPMDKELGREGSGNAGAFHLHRPPFGGTLREIPHAFLRQSR